MEFRDLKAQYTELKPAMDQAIAAVIDKANFISGSQVSDLETTLADYVGVKHCISCGNGTDALTMMMMAWNIGEGDAIFVPDFTFFASAEVVAFEGATPIFYDVCEETFNADILSLESAIQAVLKENKLHLKAIIAVDLFGQPANYPQLEQIAKKYNMLLLEDAAQGFGGKIGNKKACSFGDAATTSFFPAKPLGCYGDGGAIFTDDDETADYLRSIRVHGKGNYKYDNIRIGWNSRLDTLQAAILQVKFSHFKNFELQAVNNVAEEYTNMLNGIVKTPKILEGFYSSWAQYTVLTRTQEERALLQNYLKQKGIPTMIYYPKGMHEQEAFANSRQYTELTISEKLCGCVLSLPMHPYLTEQEVESVTDNIRKFIEYYRNDKS
ncbi:DegT/DnrJ/EryC1/StrS family aminotransferase [Bariatricus massiliensis]|uniref:DegT/DnrJ/EryC1/StrS family aminotransferase n=2 Tax=Bariatricus massiliensis TaxID=1745713 RepID=A0ABS8DIT6_9FIRM|nr:DegT/DnrJ/EryC1/StrS family aminotransferase [Bariatricus massiliensis]MCB7305210.1 DegT/DnrJ/EryC1/StrS family aminotransferase [Bariatricus massiliensis]MCB7375682.1 DegT/DnrJ/EryC1/StrS family aminotransferase [Bariatricus massiliensis]MCB7388353.1 DegT/DnrJ/EryC1/StrS family aminotransferase [Bariatricus massiliensis]MCB7412444.1 DegT/DnrJ/EryC1/StrS family aminotransferase [Bariatricus massiliensis]MCQ5254162.1 DegT/DnrJ/EryC1/StrS family aminotransferase [Bariatricus massiliensis]